MGRNKNVIYSSPAIQSALGLYMPRHEKVRDDAAADATERRLSPDVQRLLDEVRDKKLEEIRAAGAKGKKSK